MARTCAFIGLGVMGYPMAGHLQQNGFNTTVYNRTTAKAEQWVQEYGGQSALTPAAAASGKAIVMLCVGNDDDVRSVVYGDNGVLGSMAPGSILIDHTTASAELARELSNAADNRGIWLLDAPVSGHQQGAINGVLTAMVGGHQTAFEQVGEALASYAKTIEYMRAAGSGQLAKMVNQICIAGVVQGLAEGLQFAKNAGLDQEKLVAAISKGAAGSWQMENRSATMWRGEFDFGFAIDWMRKDLQIALNEAQQNGSRLPLTALVDQFYGDIQAAGGNRFDTSSLITRLVSPKR